MASGYAPQDSSQLIPAKKNFKMALLGITGSGKTSLIDLIFNYAILRNCEIDSLKTYRDTESEDKSEAMESKTNACVHYNVTVKNVLMEIIDTPGLQDSRGAEKNQENIENIISTLKKGKYVNCICLVMNGRNSRFDQVTRQAITDILGILPQEVKKNTVIVYTNSESSMDISSEHKKIKTELRFSSIKGFMLDNAYCGWINMGQNKGDDDLQSSSSEENNKKILQERLQDNFKMLDGLFEHIKSLKKISTDCFGYLRKVSSEIQLSYKELQALERTKLSLEMKIASLKDELQDAKNDVKKLKSKIDFVRTNVIRTPDVYNTVCEADGCFSNCHAPCIFTGMLSRNVKKCRCIEDDGKCNVCGHHYTYHAHQKFMYNESEVQLKSTLIEELQEAETEEKQTKILLSEQRIQLIDLKYNEKQAKLKSSIAILLAEIQGISSNSDYEKIIDNELTQYYKFFDNFFQIPQKDLTVQLGLANYREGLIMIQDMPYGNQMTDEDKKIWAYKILNIDPDDIPLTLESIHEAFSQQSRKYMDIIKEGNDAVQKRQIHAKHILEQYISQKHKT